jgi:hypothetical protein
MKLKNRGSHEEHCLCGVRKPIVLLGGSQASSDVPSGKGRRKLRLLGRLERVT